MWRDHYWQLPQGITITKPNGSISTLGAVLVQGMPRLGSQDQPAGSGCAASTSEQTYDANGNVASADDFNGNRVCYCTDLSRNLESTRVEGLPNTTSCDGVTPAGAVLPTGSRKVSSVWHSDWRLKAQEAEPRKLSTYVYNGQPDPTAGNAIASCTPSAALLPDGKPIAVLCKKVEQTTTDADGSQGFNATLDASVAIRMWTYIYNQYGQVLTAKGPRTDVNNTSTYTYYADTTSDHTLGDLQSVTNPAGHVMQYLRYDKAGRLLRSIDSTGVSTDITYKPRGWVESVTVTPAGGGAAQVTIYSYDAVVQLKQVTLPDAVTLQYIYDDAHRLTGITDGAGNTVTYTLDNAGNRTGERLKDAGGNLARNITRVFDALGRVQQVTGAGQ